MGCSECGGETVWDDAAASEICTECGTLTDPGQVVLTNQTWANDAGQYPERWGPPPPNTLKNPRTNWALAGQGQESRDRKNAYTMANFIKSLAVSMNASGLAPRATTLFNQAKSIGYFRWGRKSKLVAGACLIIALRESSRPDSIHDIAVLLKCSPQLLSRTFISVTSALQITTNPVDPSVFMTTLQTHLASILQESQADSGLPSALLKTLRTLSLHAVTHTATSLCHVLARLCPFDGMSKPSAASTACAIFMLSLEAEARSTLSALGDLGKALGARLGIGKTVVMTQYKAIQDQVATLIEKVPWLSKYESVKGRAKVAKRTIVARGLKDVIKFNEEIFHKVLLPDVRLELSSDELAEDQDDASEKSTTGSEAEPTSDARPPKRRKIHHTLDEATRFLLNPLAIAGPSQSRPKSKPSKPYTFPFPLTSYVLSTSSLSTFSHVRPTRLQLLVAERGGSDEVAIPDDELFVEGELESFLRDEKEAAILQRVLGWDQDDEDNEEDGGSATEATKTRRKSKNKETEPRPKKSRLNLEALAQFMKGSSSADEDDKEEGDDGSGFEEDQSLGLLGLDAALHFGDGEKDDEDHESVYSDEDDGFSFLGGDSGTTSRATPYSSALSHTGEEELVIDGWRPASPTGGAGGYDNQYEEEYD
ncbi:hypothetical protein CC1G_03907 [Coprinopsis cinerea okayama7|uniref:Uncharacterized protein n=1 Tax=Coprinopsis cinerea (strain Okayama-7 / 130 / ATCC MYA-4618 / FGSC 9003) TaxID=240176 RepID=A8NH61_COPC7|nr:hypothetical protein CC1G_03907 [Coprinopsis cinerea okayama7\|eukprot:XP_001833690.1 hypothetical protein CC1G_03907 [Coprinopsis cinerea okayama7\